MLYMCHLEKWSSVSDTHVMVRFDHSPLPKFVPSTTKNDKDNNWSQEIHAITPHIETKHIKGKDNILAESLSRLKH